jgi:hypothetical protein
VTHGAASSVANGHFSVDFYRRYLMNQLQCVGPVFAEFILIIEIIKRTEKSSVNKNIASSSCNTDVRTILSSPVRLIRRISSGVRSTASGLITGGPRPGVEIGTVANDLRADKKRLGGQRHDVRASIMVIALVILAAF